MRKLGPISCLEKTTSDSQAPTVILFHGFGADAYDLQPLSEVLHGAEPLNWLFPQGPLEVPIGPGWTGRAWWPIDVEALQIAAMSGVPRDLSQVKPAELPALREKVFQMIKALNLPWSKIILGGFSQGSMLATDIYLHAPETPRGLMILSGALINKEEWKGLVERRRGEKFFMSHGSGDAVLNIRGASQLESLLVQSGGLKGSLYTFHGGHEIPRDVVAKASEYLAGIN